MSNELVYARGSMLYTDVKVDGKRVRKSTGFRVGQEAQATLVAAQLQAGAAVQAGPGSALKSANSITLGEAVHRAWVTLHSTQKAAQSTRRAFGQAIAHFGKDRDLGSITREDMEAWAAKLTAEGYLAVKKRGLSGRPNAPATVNRKLAMLGALMTMAATHWGIPIVKPRMPTREPKPVQRHYLAPADLARIVAAETNDHLQRLWQFLAHTGCRVGEAQKMTSDQLSVVDGVGILQFIDSKNGKNRALPLTAEALAALQGAGAEKGERFFALSYRYYWRMFKVAAKEAGVVLPRGTAIHVTRHTVATQLISQGVPIQEVREWLGHATVTTTEIYAKVMPVQLKRLADVLSGPASAIRIKQALS